MVALKDIAKETNFSINTVSLALRGVKRISPETMAFIKETAISMGYRPSRAALSLRNNENFDIAVVVPKFSLKSINEIFSGIQECFFKTPYRISLYFESDFFEIDKCGIDTMAVFKERPSACVMVRTKIAAALASKLKCENIPFVNIAVDKEELGDSVHINYEQGVYDSIKYMADHGCRKIIYIGRHNESKTGRKTGYIRAIKKLKRKNFILTANAIGIDAIYQEGMNMARKIATMKPRPDGIQAFNDTLAAGLLAGFHSVGLKVPENISIVGFDDSSIAPLTYPRLTSIALPGREAGIAAGKILQQRLSNGKKLQEKNKNLWKEFSTKLVVRESA